MQRQQRRLRINLWVTQKVDGLRLKWRSWRVPPAFTSRRFLISAYIVVLLIVGTSWYWRPQLNRTPSENPLLQPGGGFGWLPDEITTPQPGGEVAPVEPPSETTVSEPPNETPQQQTPSAHETEAPAQPVVSFTLTRLEYPVDGEIIKTYSASAYWEVFDDWRPHLALDFAAPEGTPIGAAAAGRVKSITKEFLWGTVITVDHGGGYETRYANIAEPAVQEGQSVAAKQIIGKLGTNPPAELLDDNHLHFELLKDGKPIDPRNLFR